MHKYLVGLRVSITGAALILLLIWSIHPSLLEAAQSNCSISDTDRFAWSDRSGWINFSPENGNVHVTDQGLTGYAWSAQHGWINLNPSQGGVRNDGAGHLSGYAWGENTGWIDFSNVDIDASGRFTGTASGSIVGTITFDCSQCKVTTDWQASNSQSATVTNSGGGLPAGAYNPPLHPAPSISNPTGNFRVVINGGSSITATRDVILNLYSGKDTANMAISENDSFSGAAIQPYSSIRAWTLSAGDGPKTVYVKFYTKYGVASDPVSVTIMLHAATAPQTGSSSSSSSSSSTGTSAAAPAVTTYRFARNLKSGSTGTDVKALQQFLNRNGFTVASTGPGSKGKETTKYGAATARAIMKFQKKYGIKPVNGLFGPLTRAKVNALQK